MKIKYKQKGLTISNGVHFENFCEVTVSDVIGKELLKQSNLFEAIGSIEAIETKETKEVPKAKTTRNTKTVKPKEQTKETKETKTEIK